MTEGSKPQTNPDDKLNPYIDGLTHSAVEHGLETTKKVQEAAQKKPPVKNKPFHFYRKVLMLGGALAALVSAATGIEKVNEARVLQELNDLGANAYVGNIETDPNAVTITERTRIEMSLFERTIQQLKSKGVMGNVALAFDVVDGDKTTQIQPDPIDLSDPQAAIDMLTKTQQELAPYSGRQHVAVRGSMELQWYKNIGDNTFGVDMVYSTENLSQKTDANGEIVYITDTDPLRCEGPGFNPEVNVMFSVAPIPRPPNSLGFPPPHYEYDQEKQFTYVLPEPHGTFTDHWLNGKIQIYYSNPPAGPLFRDLDPGDKGILLSNFPGMLPDEVAPKFISAVASAPIYKTEPPEVALAP